MSGLQRSEEAVRSSLGRYRLVKKIAVGGMAELYLARVSGAGGFEKDVVVKRMLPQHAERDDLSAMFLDEARIAATLQHPNVVQVYDAGEAGGECYIAMEFLDGTDLRTLRKVLADRRAPLPWEHAVYIASSVAAGLHYAHEKRGADGEPLGIVHRDVTPHNVFLTRDGGVKLVDFGIAKARGRLTETVEGTLKGKLAYLSPEQCAGDPVDRRSDVYSLGILLYELTTGRRLYQSSSDLELMREIIHGEVEAPSGFMEYPDELEHILLDCLAKDPDDRYPSARDVQLALEGFARRHGLMLSSLAFADFLDPLLDDAERIAEQRRERHRPRPLADAPVARITRARGTPSPELPLDGRGDDDGDGDGTRTVQVSSEMLARLAEEEQKAFEEADAAPRFAHTIPSDRVRTPSRLARGTSVARSAQDEDSIHIEIEADEPEDAAAAPAERDALDPRLFDLDADADARSAETPAPGAPQAEVAIDETERVEAPRRTRARTLPPAPELDPTNVKLQKRGGGLWLLALMLIGGGVAGWQALDGRANPAPRAAPADTAPRWTTGVLQIVGPEGTGVWLFLGRTPVDAYAVHGANAHRVRIEHDGYQPQELTLGEDSWQRNAGGVREAVAEVALTPLGAEATPVEPAAALPARRTQLPSRLRIRSTPSAAGAWLYLGTTPGVQVGNLDLSQRHELRIEPPEGAPSFAVVRPDAFDSAGRATLTLE